MEKKCIVVTKNGMLAQMVSYMIKTLRKGMSVVHRLNLSELYKELQESMNFDVYAILDVHMFAIDVEAVCKKIYKIKSSIFLISISVEAISKIMGLKLYLHGANCIISNDESSEKIQDIFERAFRGENYYPEPLLQAVKNREHYFLSDVAHNDLSKREKEVLYLLAEKMTTKEVALKLCITSGAVGVALHRIRQKLGVPTKEDAIMLAVNTGDFSY